MNTPLGLFKIICVLLALAFTGQIHADDFTDGLHAYHNSQYTEAASAFKRSLEVSESAAGHHNLALSLFQQGQSAPAVWHLERARRLDPLNQSYLFKLGALRQQLGLYQLPSTWWQSIANVLSQGTWLWIASISFWILLAAIVLPHVGGFRRHIGLKLLTTLALIGMFLSGSAWIIQTSQQASGVVVANEAIALHHAPASAAPEAGLARPGERARVLDQHNNFLKIKTEADITGWINALAFRAL